MKTYFKALSIILNNAENVFYFLKSKKKNIINCINNISVENIYSKQNIPEFNNSAMDGYAIISKNTENIKDEKIFFVLNTIPAEKKIEYKKIKENNSLKIMTGAKIPDIFDSVIKKEDVDIINEKKIIIKKNVKIEENVRMSGSDYKSGEIILEKGEIIKPSHILAISATGIKQIKILSKPKIYLLCTGNEITDKKIKKNKNFSKIFNSSGPYIKNFFKLLDFEIKYLGLCQDNKKKFIKKIEPVISNDDTSIIITTGAVSEGSFDFVSSALNDINAKILFHKIKIKPGKPILFAKQKENKYFFCLPGNPVSSIIGIRFFIYPFLRQILRIPKEKPIKAKLETKYDLKFKNDSFLKTYCYCKNSNFYAKILNEQDSYKTKPILKSNSFIMIKKNEFLKINDLVNVYFYNPINL